MAEQKQPFHLIGGAADPKAAAAELARLRAEIEARNKQETAIAELGQAALTGVDPYIVFGAILAYSSTQRDFEDYEIAFLKSVANLVGETVERGRVEQARRRSESRFQQLIASTLEAVITLDRSTNVIEWNPQAEATFGI